MAEAKKKARTKKRKKLSTEKLGLRLGNVLERYKKRWDSKEFGELARQLREFADALEGQQKGGGEEGEGMISCCHGAITVRGRWRIMI